MHERVKLPLCRCPSCGVPAKPISVTLDGFGWPMMIVYCCRATNAEKRCRRGTFRYREGGELPPTAEVGGVMREFDVEVHRRIGNVVGGGASQRGLDGLARRQTVGQRRSSVAALAPQKDGGRHGKRA